MDINKYVENRISSCFAYEACELDRKIIQFEGVGELIYKKLASKKYRKTALSEDAVVAIKRAIDIRVSKNLPIKFSYPFGGYKLWKLPSSPYVDMAEFFTIAYLCEYLAPILKVYKPGVEINLVSDDVFMPQLNNYSSDELEKYRKSFVDLLEVFKESFPDNFKFNYIRVADLYSTDEYKLELKNLYEIELNKSVKPEYHDLMIRRMELHHKIIDDNSREMWEQLIPWSEAYISLSKRKALVRGEDTVVLFSERIPKAIDIGSTIASRAKFWVGVGVLEYVDGKYTEKILSPKQWEKSFNQAKTFFVNDGLLPNIKSVPLFESRLQFSV